MDIKEWTRKNEITISVRTISRNPHMSDMPSGSRHYSCNLRRGVEAIMRVPFSQGPAITNEPTAEDVLDCLASDASTYLGAQGFSGWCADLGYSDDSIKARKTYDAIKAQSIELRDFLGTELMDELLYQTERL